MSSFHLKGLDSFRAVAALSVIIYHIELLKSEFGYQSFLHLPFFQKGRGGHYGVVLFFVLSGYLITILLLKEKQKSRNISLKDFYKRRILRVWPLYYLIILVSWIIMDYSPSIATTALCLSIFPNVAYAAGIIWLASPQIWSIGVEEQFYIAWPILVKKVKSIMRLLVLFFIGYSILPHLILFYCNNFYPDAGLMTFVNKFFYSTKFNCMAVGAIGAVLYHEKSRWIEYMNRYMPVSYSLLLLPFILWFSGWYIPYFSDELYGVLFALSILVVSTNDRMANPDIGVSRFLGKISYGLYMYHWLVISLLLRWGVVSADKEGAINNLLLYPAVILMTIAVSTLSYYYVEGPFLRLKERFSRV